jgi:hypothetical protein
VQWWQWLVVALVVVAVLGGLFIGIQSRRRRGGVIVRQQSGVGPAIRPGLGDGSGDSGAGGRPLP